MTKRVPSGACVRFHSMAAQSLESYRMSHTLHMRLNDVGNDFDACVHIGISVHIYVYMHVYVHVSVCIRICTLA